MVLLRLALRPDGRMVVGALGMAAALLLPMAATLVLGALAPRIGDAAVIATPNDYSTGLDLGALPAPQLAVSHRVIGGVDVFAYVVGPDLVARGHAISTGLGHIRVSGFNVSSQSQRLGLVPDGALLVNAESLAGAPVVAALYPSRIATVPGMAMFPARGADAFEAATVHDLQTGTGFVILVSVPAVAMVAIVFARQEAREHQPVAATLAACGGHRQARWVLLGRIGLMVGLAFVAASFSAYLLWRFGGPSFRSAALPWSRLALVSLAPAVAALGAGLGVGAVSLSALRLLRSQPGEVPEQIHLGLPLLLRPLLLGLRITPVILVAALLFAVDVGFPIAAAGVPASLGGTPGEWVLGGEAGIQVGRGVDAAVAQVAGLDPHVEAIVAETIVPTLLNGLPAVARGGNWTALASYHGLRLEGTPPGDFEILVGVRLAGRSHITLGQSLAVLGAERPFVQQLRVVGIVHGPQLLEDEAFVTTTQGQYLAGLQQGQATLVRFRPETEEANKAVGQVAPNIQVAGISMNPTHPRAGSIANVTVDVANLGVQKGVRHLTLRVDGLAVSERDAVLGGHARSHLNMTFIVPPGDFQVQVNPESNGSSTPGETLDFETAVPQVALKLSGAAGPIPGRTVRIHRELADAIEGIGELARGITDTNGEIHVAMGAGDYVAVANGTFVAFVITQGPGRIEATNAWVVPADPIPNVPAHAFVTIHNPGNSSARTSLEVTAAGKLIQLQDVELGAGQSRTVDLFVVLDPGVQSITVAGLQVQFGTVVATDAAAPPVAGPVVATSGATVQAQVATRALGNARGTLLMLGVAAMASSLSAISLGTQRSLRARKHVAGVWRALGRNDEEVRSRAAWEAGALGALAMAAMLIPAKLVFVLVSLVPQAVAFGHSVPDPIGWLFALQSTAAFAAVCALTAYLAAGKSTARALR